MEYVIVFILMGVVTAVVASNKGRSAVGWFLIGVLFGPIGLILSLVVSKNIVAIEGKKVLSGEMKRCPFCAELIKQEALVCRFCSRELDGSEESCHESDFAQKLQMHLPSGTDLDEIRKVAAQHLRNPRLPIDDKKALLILVGGDFQWKDAYGLCSATFLGETRVFPSGAEFSQWFRASVLPVLNAVRT